MCCAASLTLSGQHVWASDTEVATANFDEDLDEAPVLINRARPLKMNLEIALMFTPTVIEKYLAHLGGMGGVALHINDIVAVELMGGYMSMREAGIIGGASSVRTEISSRLGRDPDLPDLVGMSWLVQGGLTLAPIYGKLNFFSEFDLTSQVYIAGGVGAVGAVRRTFTPVDASDLQTTSVTSEGVKFAGNFGIGFRLFFARWFAIRVEFRDIVYSHSYDFSGAGTPQLDIIHNLMGMFGLSFVVN